MPCQLKIVLVQQQTIEVKWEENKSFLFRCPEFPVSFFAVVLKRFSVDIPIAEVQAIFYYTLSFSISKYSELGKKCPSPLNKNLFNIFFQIVVAAAVQPRINCSSHVLLLGKFFCCCWLRMKPLPFVHRVIGKENLLIKFLVKLNRNQYSNDPSKPTK